MNTAKVPVGGSSFGWIGEPRGEGRDSTNNQGNKEQVVSGWNVKENEKGGTLLDDPEEKEFSNEENEMANGQTALTKKRKRVVEAEGIRCVFVEEERPTCCFPSTTITTCNLSLSRCFSRGYKIRRRLEEGLGPSACGSFVCWPIIQDSSEDSTSSIVLGGDPDKLPPRETARISQVPLSPCLSSPLPISRCSNQTLELEERRSTRETVSGSAPSTPLGGGAVLDEVVRVMRDKAVSTLFNRNVEAKYSPRSCRSNSFHTFRRAASLLLDTTDDGGGQRFLSGKGERGLQRVQDPGVDNDKFQEWWKGELNWQRRTRSGIFILYAARKLMIARVLGYSALDLFWCSLRSGPFYAGFKRLKLRCTKYPYRVNPVALIALTSLVTVVTYHDDLSAPDSQVIEVFRHFFQLQSGISAGKEGLLRFAGSLRMDVTDIGRMAHTTLVNAYVLCRPPAGRFVDLLCDGGGDQFLKTASSDHRSNRFAIGSEEATLYGLLNILLLSLDVANRSNAIEMAGGVLKFFLKYKGRGDALLCAMLGEDVSAAAAGLQRRMGIALRWRISSLKTVLGKDCVGKRWWVESVDRVKQFLDDSSKHERHQLGNTKC